MVNYLYDLAEIERNHEAYANQDAVAASSVVKKGLPRARAHAAAAALPAPGG
jgi:malonyl-CoA decarboxylase